MRMAVDLPAPLLPRSPKTSPAWTEKVRSSTAVKAPKRLTSPSTEMTAVMGLPPAACAR